jgi:hypothetical protein
MVVGSAIMLDNANALNDVNPFVIDGPGTSNKPYGFSPEVPDKDHITCDSYGCSVPSFKPELESQKYVEKKVSDSPWEPIEKPPLCPWGINVPTNGSLNAPPSCLVPIKNPVSCPMKRPLEPTQEFIPDLYTLIPYKDPLPTQLQTLSAPDYSLFIIIFLIAVLVLLVRR